MSDLATKAGAGPVPTAVQATDIHPNPARDIVGNHAVGCPPEEPAAPDGVKGLLETL
jgi:hypothetical protein